MLMRILSMLLITLMAAGFVFGQSNDNKGRILTDDQKNVVEPGLETPDKPVPSDGPMLLITPNGKEIWNEGTVQTIEWQVRAKVQVDSVLIRLIDEASMKTAKPRIIDLAVVKGNPGKWVWEGVTPPMERCKIEVHAFAPEKILLVDESDAVFSIPRDLIPLDDPKQNQDSKVSNQAPAPEKQK